MAAAASFPAWPMRDEDDDDDDGARYDKITRPLGTHPIDRIALQWYYQKVMPLDEVCARLCYEQYNEKLFPATKGHEDEDDEKRAAASYIERDWGEDFLAYREFSVQTSGGIVSRYHSFKSPAELRHWLVQRVERTPPGDPDGLLPVKIDVGACYTGMLSSFSLPGVGTRKVDSASKACYGEFKLDFDLSSYSDVRTCGCGSCCNECWYLAVAALRMTDWILRHEFALKNVGHVFSGSKGVHVWSWGSRGGKLTDDLRKNLVMKYIMATVFSCETMALGIKEMRKFLMRWPFKGYLDVLEGEFFLERALRRRKLLAPGTTFRNAVESTLKQACIRARDGEERTYERMVRALNDFVTIFGETTKNEDRTNHAARVIARKREWDAFLARIASESPLLTKDGAVLAEGLRQGMVFCATFPRPDAAVTTSMKHLLKMPFSPHPKTAKISVPLPSDSKEIDPDTMPDVPTVRWLWSRSVEGGGRNEERLIETFRARYVRPLRDTFAKAMRNEQTGKWMLPGGGGGARGDLVVPSQYAFPLLDMPLRPFIAQQVAAAAAAAAGRPPTAAPLKSWHWKKGDKDASSSEK